MRKYLLFSLVAMMCFAFLLLADTRGRLTGNVVDEKGEPLAGVKVTLKDSKYESFQKILETNEKGRFEQSGLQPHIFKILCEKEGYATVEAEKKVRMGYSVHIDLQMPSLEWVQQQSETPRDVAAKAYNQALDLLEQGKGSEAIEYFRKALENEDALGKDLYKAYKLMGKTFFDNNEQKDARLCFEKVVELKPDDFASYFLLGKIHDKLREEDMDNEDYHVEKAIMYWEKGFENFPKGQPMDRTIPFNIGILYTKQNNTDKAIEWFKQAMEIDEKFHDAHMQLAIQYMVIPDITSKAELKKEAVGYLESYIALYPNDPLTPSFKETLKQWK